MLFPNDETNHIKNNYRKMNELRSSLAFNNQKWSTYNFSIHYRYNSCKAGIEKLKNTPLRGIISMYQQIPREKKM